MKTKPELTAPCTKILMEAAETHNERYKVYGNNFLHMGTVLMGMFPEGLALKTADDFNRFNLFIQVVGKMSRYAQNLDKGGHIDSAHDACVYSAMLQMCTK